MTALCQCAWPPPYQNTPAAAGHAGQEDTSFPERGCGCLHEFHKHPWAQWQAGGEQEVFLYREHQNTLCVKDEWGNKLKVIIVLFLPGGVTKSLAALFFFPASVDESWDFG